MRKNQRKKDKMLCWEDVAKGLTKQSQQTSQSDASTEKG